MNESRKLLKDLSFVVVDLETTGGNHETDKIIEIGLVRIENLEIVDELHYLINPEIPIPSFIQKLTQISEDDIKHAPVIDTVIDEVLSFVGESIVVAHNVSFDLPFLNSELIRLDKPKLKNKALCTNLMTKYMIPNILSSNLNYMSQIFEIPHNQAHRALEDAKACAHLLLEYLEIFIQKHIRKVNQLYYPRAKFELDRANFNSDEKDEFFIVIEKISTPALVSLKGNNGLQLASVPLSDPCLEKEVLRTMFEQTPFETMTIQLQGSFFEAFIQLNMHFNKFDPKVQNLILEYLHKQYLDGKPTEFNQDEFSTGLDSENFLVSRHLVPGQLVIYPLFNLHSKNELIFRFPGHKKRLNHYATGHIKRLEQSKKKSFRHAIHRELFPFLDAFIEKKKNSKDKDYLFVSKNVIKEDKGKFYNYVHNFMNFADGYSKYPKKHI